jgi:Uncharacterized conserved protein (DUF2290)
MPPLILIVGRAQSELFQNSFDAFGNLNLLLMEQPQPSKHTSLAASTVPAASRSGSVCSLPKNASDWDALNDMLESELFAQIQALEPPRQDDLEAIIVPVTSLLRLRSPIRFDYDPEKQTLSEPSSHVHLSDAGTRIPVHAGLSLGTL